MEVVRHLRPLHTLQTGPRQSILAIGNFDGVHLGHQAILKQVICRAKQQGLHSAVMTFEPHPKDFFSHEGSDSIRLTSLKTKLRLLSALGIDRTYIIRFNEPFSKISAARFIDAYLIHGACAKEVLVGQDFRFGLQRKGDVLLLETVLATAYSKVVCFEDILLKNQRISSSRIRFTLQANDLKMVGSLLGRPYSLCGRVLKGRQLGRQLGFPTANIGYGRHHLALSGVYAVTVKGVLGQSKSLQGVANVGVRPSVSRDEYPSVEVYLFDFCQNIYHAHLEVIFHHKIRDEVKFPSLDRLKLQIAQDCRSAIDYFQSQ